jgi:hypothetical protein
MIFTTCDPLTNPQRVEAWREAMLLGMPELTEEDLLKQVRLGLGLRNAWNGRFGSSARSRSRAAQDVLPAVA